MASHPHSYARAAKPLSRALAIIPSLPRPLLSRIVARAIERLDEMDGDADLEDDDPLEIAWVERHSFNLPGGFFLKTLTEDDEDGHDREGVWFG